MNRLRKKYEKEVVPELMKTLGIKNKFALPKITKVIVNMGVGDALKSKEAMKQLKKDMSNAIVQEVQINKIWQ